LLWKQEVICWDKIVQKNGVSNKEDPEMKKINFYERRKNFEERIKTFISLSPYVEKRKVLRYYSRMAKQIHVQDNTRFNYLELFNNFVELLLWSVYREHEHGIQSEVKLKENYFITGLENKLQTIRRKYRTCMEERIKSFEQYVTSLLLTSLRKPCELSSKQIWASQIKKMS
jgi:hypothetical protein